MNREGKRPVSVEDLLRLKRAERPADSFWADFDRQLRAKQLAALVEKRPWWHSLTIGSWAAAFRRHPLPLGASLALVAGWFVMRDASRSAAPDGPAMAASVVTAAPATMVSTAADPAPDVRAVSPSPVAAFSPADAGVPSDESVAPVAAPVIALDSSRSSLAVAEVEPAKSLFVASVPLSLEAQSSLLMPSAEPLASSPLLGGTMRLEARAPASRSAVEPLRQITPPADRRGSRILTAMVSMASVENAMRTTERAASRLSEEQLYDQIRRVGAVGAAVNVKF